MGGERKEEAGVNAMKYSMGLLPPRGKSKSHSKVCTHYTYGKSIERGAKNTFPLLSLPPPRSSSPGQGTRRATSRSSEEID